MKNGIGTICRHAALILLVVCACAALAAASFAASLAPAVGNSGFEDGTNGWGWMPMNGVMASYRASTENPHSGARCLVLTNESGFAPNVYGRLSQAVNVLPDTEYELSLWVRGEEVADTPGTSHLTDWHCYTLNLPGGTFDWQRVSTVFRSRPDQYSVTLGLNLVNTCKALAIDDISLRPIGAPLKGDGFEGSFLAPTRLTGTSAPSYTGVFTSTAPAGAVVEATVKAGDITVFEERAALEPGEDAIEWTWNTGRVPFGELTCSVRVMDAAGTVIASGAQAIALVESPISAEIDRAEARLREFNDLYRRCRAKGISLDYQDVAKTMLDQFIPLAREDVQKGHDWRAQFAAQDFHRSLDEAISDMRAYLADPSLAPNAVRYQTGHVNIKGTSLIGDRRDTTGAKTRGPLFFCGYGHFFQIMEDMPRWPGYGVNLLQTGILGPAQALMAEDEASLDTINLVVKLLDDAAKQNVRVDVLLSPHYFPQWAIEKWPHIARGGGHFLGYCVDAPEAKQVIESFLRLVVPVFKDKPALHSFCLTNEPVFNNTAGCGNTRSMWGMYLARVHGSLKTMNERYGTDYAAFEDVPIPGNEAYDAPQFHDYCVFNHERFAAWHKWMADIIREMAPDVPVHIKMMSMALPHRFTISWGCDPELFGELSDLDGNDCLIRGGPGGGWGMPFHLQNMSYDLQRSLSRKPIFNSENHPTDDRSTYYVPPEHMRTALWQGAIHGQTATTIWVWERTFDRGSDLYGNVMDRPGCAQAVGTTCLDLNRFAEEVTALQNKPAPVAIIFSIASITNAARYQEVLYRAYCALNFCGTKVDFISEKQLAVGKGAGYKMIVLPAAANVLPATFAAIRRLPGSTRLVFIDDGLTHDPYGKSYPPEDVARLREHALCLADGDPRKVLWPALREELGRLGALPEYSVVDASTGEPVWGVEWLPARTGGRTVINIVNLKDTTVELEVRRKDRPVRTMDLFSLGGREAVRQAKPITPILAEVSE